MTGAVLAQILAEEDVALADPPLDSAEAALDALASRLTALTEVMMRNDYIAAVRLHRRSRRALRLAGALIAALPVGSEKAGALERLTRLRVLAMSMFTAAPKPSAKAIARARGGDLSAWEHEAQAWIAAGSALDIPALVRQRRARDTQPESPLAFRAAEAARNQRCADIARAGRRSAGVAFMISPVLMLGQVEHPVGRALCALGLGLGCLYSMLFSPVLLVIRWAVTLSLRSRVAPYSDEFARSGRMLSSCTHRHKSKSDEEG